jgi:hypothetical protein
MDEAARHGFQADDQGRMVKPDNYAALNRQMTDVLLRRHQG